MASATTATATMAAAGFDKRPSAASSLQTPGSGTFPSEMLSPMAASPGCLKREEALKTPITPPSAYLDFLKNFTPAMTPASTGTSTRFSIPEKPSEGTSDTCPKSSTISPPASEPTLSRNTSYDSTTTNDTNSSAQSFANSEPPMSGRRGSKPGTPRIIIPTSQFAKPGPRSSRTPRRLHVPGSPFSPALSSAPPAPSPYTMSSTPKSAAPWSASFSPREQSADSQNGRVHVRHVVTRTVTYSRTSLDPAPKGKRRKIEDTTSSNEDLSTEPPIKQEKIEELGDKTDESGAEAEGTETPSEGETDQSSTTA